MSFLAGSLIAQRMALEKLKKLAPSEDEAKWPRDLGLDERLLKLLVANWGAKKTDDGRYYYQCQDKNSAKK